MSFRQMESGSVASTAPAAACSIATLRRVALAQSRIHSTVEKLPHSASNDASRVERPRLLQQLPPLFGRHEVGDPLFVFKTWEGRVVPAIAMGGHHRRVIQKLYPAPGVGIQVHQAESSSYILRDNCPSTTILATSIRASPSEFRPVDPDGVVYSTTDNYTATDILKT